MHNNFSEWYLSAGITLESDTLLKRWEGVEAFSAGSSEIVPLVELFFGFPDATEDFMLNFRQAFQKADAAFRMRDNNRELSVLAGAKLTSIMEGSSDNLGDFAALALVSCAAQNLRAAPCVTEIPEIAAQRLARRSINRNLVNTATLSDDKEESTELMQVKKDLAVVKEECNVLWWVFGETSRDLDKRWSKISVGQAALIAGKELADLTGVLPGPAAAAALLDKIIKTAQVKPPTYVAIKDAIAEIPADWRREFAREHSLAGLKNLCPVSHGIKLSVDLSENDAWAQALPASAKIHRGGRIAPHLLAYQIFVERLLAVASVLEK